VVVEDGLAVGLEDALGRHCGGGGGLVKETQVSEWLFNPVSSFFQPLCIRGQETAFEIWNPECTISWREGSSSEWNEREREGEGEGEQCSFPEIWDSTYLE